MVVNKGGKIMQKKLNIKGMHCSSCETLIKDSLEELGAAVKKIDHKTGDVVIDFDENKVSLDAIKTAVKKEGYTVQ